MAEGERRLVFDTRGRRKHVVRVVYAILALLMGSSLFLVVGPFNIGSLLGSNSTTNASKVFEEQIERIEGKLRREPDNEALLLSLTRAHIGAGNALAETSPETGVPVVTPEGRAQLEEATQAWTRYTKLAEVPNSSAAQLVSRTYFSLAETSRSFEEAVINLKRAAEVQQVAADAQPNLGTLSTLAIDRYYAGDFAAGDEASKKAAATAPSKEEKKEVEKQLAEYRKRGKQFEKQKQEAAKLERKTGKETLQNPFGGLGSTTGSLGQ